MTKLELQNKIATIEKGLSKVSSPASRKIFEETLQKAREELAALEGAAPSPAPSGGGSELEKLYEQREKMRKGLQSSNAVVQKGSKMALPKIEARIAELEGASAPAPAPARRMPKPTAEIPEVPATKPMPTPAMRGRKPKADAPMPMPTPAKRGRKPSPPAPMPIPTPAMRGRKPKADAPMPMPTPAKRGRKPKAEAPMPMPTPAKRGRKPKAEAPVEIKGKIKRGRKPKVQAPAETPAKAPARRGRPSLPKGAKSQEVSLNSLTKFANSIVAFCVENGIADPNLDDVRAILNILDKGKALKFEKGGKISRSGKYISKWQIKQILTDGGMKIGSDELLSGVWLKKKVDGIAEMRRGGGIGYFVIDDNILESGKSVMLGNRRISAKNRKFQGVFEGKMVGGLMKVYDYDDEMWKVVNPDEWQQAYAEGGGVGGKQYFLTGYRADASVDSFNEGQGDLVSYFDEKISKTFSSKDDLIKYISKNITYTDHTESDFDWEYGKGKYITTSVLCSYDAQIGYFPASKSEIDLWKKGEKELYNVDYYIDVVAAIPTEYAEGGGVGNSTITNLADFDPETTIVFDGDADFEDFPEITYLGNLQEIKGYGNFRNSQVQHLGNLQTIGGSADFGDSQVKDLGNLQTIGGNAYFGDSQVQHLGNLQTIGGSADFMNSRVEHLGNLKTIVGSAFFEDSIVKRLGNLQTIGGRTFFGNRIDLKAEWESKQENNNYAEGGGVGDVYTLKDEDDTWYLTYIDSTHFFLSNTKEYKGSAYHIGQFRTRPFYNEVLSWLKSHKGQQSYAEGGGVGRKLIFESREYDMPRGKTIYSVEVENEYDDDETITEEYDNYDEAISAYRRSKLRFPITWRTYLETQKPPFVYESGIVLQDGTLKVISRKGKDVNYDFNGNEKYAIGGGVGSGSFLRYEGQSILLHSVPSPKYDRFLDKEIVIEKIDKNKIVKSFVRETGEKVPFIIDDTFKKEEYAEGGGVGSILIYNGDDVVYSTKNLLMAKLWVIKNCKKYDELIVEDSYGDSIVITKEDKLKDIDFLFSN